MYKRAAQEKYGQIVVAHLLVSFRLKLATQAGPSFAWLLSPGDFDARQEEDIKHLNFNNYVNFSKNSNRT